MPFFSVLAGYCIRLSSRISDFRSGLYRFEPFDSFFLATLGYPLVCSAMRGSTNVYTFSIKIQIFPIDRSERTHVPFEKSSSTSGGPKR